MLLFVIRAWRSHHAIRGREVPISKAASCSWSPSRANQSRSRSGAGEGQANRRVFVRNRHAPVAERSPLISSRGAGPIRLMKRAAASTGSVGIGEELSPNGRSRPPDKYLVYPVHAITRKSLGDMTRKLSVTESHRFAQLRGTVSRRKPSVASANWVHVA